MALVSSGEELVETSILRCPPENALSVLTETTFVDRDFCNGSVEGFWGSSEGDALASVRGEALREELGELLGEELGEALVSALGESIGSVLGSTTVLVSASVEPLGREDCEAHDRLEGSPLGWALGRGATLGKLLGIVLGSELREGPFVAVELVMALGALPGDALGIGLVAGFWTGAINLGG